VWVRNKIINFFFFQAEDGIRDFHVTGVQTCALPILVLHANAFTLSEMLAELEYSYQAARDPMQRMVRLAESYLRFAESHQRQWEIGRASCRERVEKWVGGVALHVIQER